MPSLIDETVFSEPSGRPFALVQLGGTLLMLGFYGYLVVVRNATPSSFILFLSVGTGLSGIAESLPNARRRTAGVLRLTALLVLVGLLVAVSSNPELFTG
ncbi:MAG: hypothetical protein ABEJ42_10005 [Halobacteriaceae archaeon]